MSYFKLKNGMELCYEDTGSGSTAVFLHGWSSSRAMYGEPIKLLKDKARCISYDHRGHSGSRNAGGEPVTLETLASDLNELINGLELTDVTLVGWSMGAAAAMTYIREYGCSALRQVVLCDMPPKLLNDDSWQLGLRTSREMIERLLRETDKDFITLYKEFMLGVSPALAELSEEELRNRLEAKLSGYDTDILRQLAVSLRAQDNREVIGRINVPLTYFYAVPGSLFRPELAEWYRENARCPFGAVGFTDSTHKFITEHPQRFADELGRLL